MARKYGTNSDVVQAWARGDSHPYSNGTGSVSHNGPTLYSYGTAIGQRMRQKGGGDRGGVVVLVVSRDDYSVTTSSHQSEAAYRSNAVPVTTLSLCKAGVDFRWLQDDIEVVDYGPDDMLFTKKSESRKHKKNRGYYLSSFMWGATQIRLLPEPCETVEQAIEMLRPQGALDKVLLTTFLLWNNIADNRNTNQGWERGYYHNSGSEWYFVELPISGKESKKVYKQMEHGECELPRKRGGDGLRYWPTRMCHAIDVLCFKSGAGKDGDRVPEWAEKVNPKSVVVSGQVRCEDKAFRVVRLSTSDRPRMFLAIPDRSVKIWAGGR